MTGKHGSTKGKRIKTLTKKSHVLENRCIWEEGDRREGMYEKAKATH